VDRILDLIMSAGLWSAIVLFVGGGFLCVRDTFAAERRNAAMPKRKPGRETEQDRPQSWVVLGD